MKLPINPGWWLVYVGGAYLIAGITNHWIYQFTTDEYIQVAYCIILSMPLYIPLLARWVGVNTLWSRNK
jgi:hypothetical protein